MLPEALDTNLDKVLRLAQPTATDHPLAIRRFMARAKVARPHEAMERAAASVVAAYKNAYSPVREPISVERLCAILNVVLTGLRPNRRSPFPDGGARLRDKPSGLLEFADPQPIIRIPPHVEFERARVAVAHELAHVLIHRKGDSYDEATTRLQSSPAEEALAEYGARLLLMPANDEPTLDGTENIAVSCVLRAQSARVTLHTAVARAGDPDIPNRKVRGAILWRVKLRLDEEVHQSLTPYWHLCGDAFIPIGKCKARKGSIIAEVAHGPGRVAASYNEDVHIGNLEGHFRVDALSWGAGNSRVVLSIFSFPYDAIATSRQALPCVLGIHNP